MTSPSPRCFYIRIARCARASVLRLLHNVIHYSRRVHFCNIRGDLKTKKVRCNIRNRKAEKRRGILSNLSRAALSTYLSRAARLRKFPRISFLYNSFASWIRSGSLEFCEFSIYSGISSVISELLCQIVSAALPRNCCNKTRTNTPRYYRIALYLAHRGTFVSWRWRDNRGIWAAKYSPLQIARRPTLGTVKLCTSRFLASHHGFTKNFATILRK